MPPEQSFLRTPVWNRFTPLQVLVMFFAAMPPLAVVGAILSRLGGLISEEAMISLALAAGENPGNIIFGAMFLASPIQWLTGRSQVRIRRYLGIVFYLLGLSNFLMFVLEQNLGASLSQPFLIAGTAALALATPLFLTTSRWSQRLMGMRRWRLLHRLTYVVAVALVAHVVQIGEFGIGATMITLGFIARIPAVRRWLSSHRHEKTSAPRPPAPPVDDARSAVLIGAVAGERVGVDQ